MELREFWRALRRHWVPAVAAFAVVMVVVTVAAFAPADTYRASSTISVEPASLSGATNADVQVVNFLMPALQAEVQTAGFAARARDRLPAGTAAVHYTVSSTVDPGTGLLTISAQSGNRAAVAPIANAYARELAASAPSQAIAMRILAPAQVPNGPVGPHRAAILLSGFVLALIVGVLAALVARAARRRRTRGEEIREAYGLAVLGELPVDRTLRVATFAELFDRADAPVIEALARLRTNVELALVRHHVTRLAVTSPGVGDGKSTVAGSMAWALASVGHSVALVEADLRRPSLTRRVGGPLERPRDPGTFTFVPAEQVRTRSGPGGERFADLHPADTVAAVLPDVLGSVGGAGVTIVDAPPIDAAETKLVVAATGWTVIVVDAHRRDAVDSLERIVAQVHEAGGSVLGVVLNRAKLGRAQRLASQYGPPPRAQHAPEPRTDRYLEPPAVAPAPGDAVQH